MGTRTGSRRNQQERTKATKAALVAAARESFIAEGFAGTSLGAICDRVGVTRGAFYHHFENKEQIFREVYAAEQKELGVVVRRAFLEPAVRRITPVEAPGALGWTVMRGIQAGSRSSCASGWPCPSRRAASPPAPWAP